jgi:hypothetical protein
MKRLMVLGIVAFAAVLMSLGTASATPVLTLCTPNCATIGATIVQVTDGIGNPLDGTVSYSGSLGVWSIDVSTGQSKVSSAILLDLNTQVYNTRSDNSYLEMTLKDTGFTEPNPFLVANTAVDGTMSITAGVAEFKSYINDTFQLADMTFATSAYPFGDTQSLDNLNIPAPYSLTVDYNLLQYGKGTTNADVAVLATPEPATLLLLGSGLAGLAGFRARRRK